MELSSMQTQLREGKQGFREVKKKRREDFLKFTYRE